MPRQTPENKGIASRHGGWEMNGLLWDTKKVGKARRNDSNRPYKKEPERAPGSLRRGQESTPSVTCSSDVHGRHTILLTWSEKYDLSAGEAWAADATVMCADPVGTLTQPQDKTSPLSTFIPAGCPSMEKKVKSFLIENSPKRHQDDLWPETESSLHDINTTCFCRPLGNRAEALFQIQDDSPGTLSIHVHIRILTRKEMIQSSS
ncbi:uncharacterized protein LOC131384165 [Hylobates moloch]|uniref:uncharacterized protein LOC131384165 n=1 Tax=Hylobates moloch TaxID=81572 RepID=UPI00267480EB|nr:uncharacterized protein LOC131384165 [Hylobates moloch]